MDELDPGAAWAARPLDARTLRRMLEHAYGPRAPREEPVVHALSTTSRNLVLRTALHDGRQVVLKIAPPPHLPSMGHETDQLGAEVEALHMVAEHTGITAPQMHHHDDSHELVDAEWFAMSHVEGHPAGLGAGDPRLAETFAALHQISGDGFGRAGASPQGSWQDAFTSIVEDLLADAQLVGQQLDVDVEHLHQLVLDRGDCLDEVTEAVWCWANTDPADLLDTGEGLALLDHGHGIWGDPLMDLDAPRTGLSAAAARRRALYDLREALEACVVDAHRGRVASATHASALQAAIDALAAFA